MLYKQFLTGEKPCSCSWPDKCLPTGESKLSFSYCAIQNSYHFFVFKSLLSPILVRPSPSPPSLPPHPIDLAIPVDLFRQTLYEIHRRWSRVRIEKLIVAQVVNNFLLPLLLPEVSLPYPLSFTASILNQFNQFHNFTPYFFKIRFSSIS